MFFETFAKWTIFTYTYSHVHYLRTFPVFLGKMMPTGRYRISVIWRGQRASVIKYVIISVATLRWSCN